ncbi:Ovule protein [Caenorhabditis elegans]|uniref:Ovule protein n=1 Tax=Caenorhabditis elegans TaxID=6239 RepID=P91287_CAEEL|nr:Ovule protein [Caenorhabditis elegans]CCD66281.1 Ovule protein [Caenorhabditis elegans]|eukprot:NP_491597.1 Uncharacterized protein CELE_F27C1.1 [Caenorhabditis elegans]
MVKKITVYTAFGQFLKMVELQMEQEMEKMNEIETDKLPIDHQLSDYQNNIESGNDRQVQSCPVDVSIPKEVMKCASCPLLCFNCSVQMPVSPVPTTIESRKINETTQLMMEFWKIVASKSEEEKLPSLFENVEGLFSVPFSTFGTWDDDTLSGVTSLNFEKSDEQLSEQDDDKTTVWSSNFPSAHVLTVYENSEQKTDEMADDEMSDTTSSFLSTLSTTMSAQVPALHLLQRVQLQRSVIKKQKKIIDSFSELQNLNKKLADLRKKHRD